MLTIILVVGYFLFCVGMAFFLDYRTKKRKLNETAVEYSTGKNSMGLFMAFSLMCGNLISSSYIIGNSSAVIEHDIAYQWTFYGYIIGWALTCAYIPIYRSICYKYGCSSLGEIFGKLFSKRVSVCVSVMIFVSFASAVSAQTVIVSNLLQSLLGIRSEVTMTVTIAAMILLALQGGMKGLARINMVHVVVLSVSVVAIFIAVMTSVGWDFGQVYRALEPQGTFRLQKQFLHHRYACHSALCYGCKCIVHLCGDRRQGRQDRTEGSIHHAYFCNFLFWIGHHSCLLWQVPVARHGSGDCLVHHCRSLRSRHGGAGQLRRAGGQYVYGADLHHGNVQYCNGALYSPA